MLLLDHPTEGGGRGKPWKWSDARELIESGYDVILARRARLRQRVADALADLGDLPPLGRRRRHRRREARRTARTPEKMARFVSRCAAER